MISVCMAVHDGSKFVKEQLSSILRQLGKGDEVVVVDDASGDDSLSIVRSFGDRRIKVLENERSLGPIASFERGLQATRGDLVFFSDQDDVWLKGKVKAVKEAFERRDCLAIVSDAVVVGERKEVIAPSYFLLRDSGPGVWKNYYKNSYLGCCLAIRAEAKRWLLPFPRTILQHDEWVGLACDFIGGVFFLREALVLYRRHGNNASALAVSRFSLPRILFNRAKFGLAILGRAPGLVRARLSRA
jgi:glycosyltransferase involved in cell wall biosynthesis